MISVFVAFVFGGQRVIAEFGIETMRDYLARVRRDRQRAWDGTYPVKK